MDCTPRVTCWCSRVALGPWLAREHKPEQPEARPPATQTVCFACRGCRLCSALWRLRARPHDLWTKHLPSVCLNDVLTGQDDAISQPPRTIGRRLIGERLNPPLRS